MINAAAKFTKCIICSTPNEPASLKPLCPSCKIQFDKNLDEAIRFKNKKKPVK